MGATLSSLCQLNQKRCNHLPQLICKAISSCRIMIAILLNVTNYRPHLCYIRLFAIVNLQQRAMNEKSIDSSADVALIILPIAAFNYVPVRNLASVASRN